MSKVLRQVAACSPSRQSGNYIYTIMPTVSGGLAAISSADELFILDRQNLTSAPSLTFPDVPTGVTCLISTDEANGGVLCAGRDGVVAAFDVRSRSRVAHFELDRPVTALSCRGYDVAIGTELAHQHAISIVTAGHLLTKLRDRRQNKARWQNAENNDDITDLQFHQSEPNHLLSGGVDGLVSIFDTNVAEEDEALLQVVNHGPVHHAGFLSDDKIYALSHDENFSIHPVTVGIESDAEDGPVPVVFGDLRPTIPCEYVIDIVRSGEAFFVAAGTHSLDPHLTLVPIRDQNQLDLNNQMVLMGAHGEEIVRSLFADVETRTVFTAGEDGQIRAFKEAAVNTESQKSNPKVKKASDARYRPY